MDVEKPMQRQVNPLMTSVNPAYRRPRVVIIGAGFGGLSVARQLAQAPFEVIVIDRHNYHLFQPLLYQVATAGLSPADIASPIRGILRRQRNASVILAKVSGVDIAGKEIVAEGRRIPFDYLVVATGTEHAYFGNDWASHAAGLKTIDDATYLRRRILLAFERAETEPDADERSRLLNFVVVGGGPTGVEMAGAIAELAKRALASDFRSIDPRCARIVLIEAGPRLLAPFHPSLSEAARRSLEQLGVEVRLGAGVTDCDCSGVSLGQERLQTRTIIWAAGIKASPAAEWLAVASDRAGRVKVQADLSAPGHPNIFVIGDVACTIGLDGKALAGVAPVAKQQGEYVASLLIARAQGKTLPPFRYRDAGSLATIGRKQAVAQLGPFKLSGFAAWLLWSLAHIYFLIGFRNRLAVAVNWAWSYVTFQRGTRLITGISGSRIEDVMPVVMAAPPMAAGLEFPDNGRAFQAPASAKLGARNEPGQA
jgi:NADH:ubiquinone reductase (H+-translocating)